MRVASAGYVAGRRTLATPAQLADHARVLFAPLNQVQPWHYRVDGPGVVHHPGGRFRTADAEQVRAAVLAGLGMAHGPRWLFGSDLACGEVKAVLDGFQSPPVQLSLVHAAGRGPSARVCVLMDFITEALPRSEFPR